MTQFVMVIHGTSVVCHVTHYSAACPMRVTGSGFGDADPPEDEEFEFYLKDADGVVHDGWIDSDVEARALKQFKELRGIR